MVALFAAGNQVIFLYRAAARKNPLAQKKAAAPRQRN